MTDLTAADLALLADAAGITRQQVERMERAGFAVRRSVPEGFMTVEDWAIRNTVQVIDTDLAPRSAQPESHLGRRRLDVAWSSYDPLTNETETYADFDAARRAQDQINARLGALPT